MRRVGDLYAQVVSFGNLYQAAHRAMTGSRHTAAAARFYFNLETEVLALKRRLTDGTYVPGPYRYFTIREPKKRTISVAPFEDRVVHHALVAVLEPIYERSFIYDSYATRTGKGTHRAVARARQFLRTNTYYLKADVAQYFPSIDHGILLGIIGRKIKDPHVLGLIERIVANSGERGLPIGNLTSQFFANVYLDLFDHFVKEGLRVHAYLRYMDDFVVFGDNSGDLKGLLGTFEDLLGSRLNVRLKKESCFINTRLNGVPFLGVRVFPNLVRIRGENLTRRLRKMRLRERELHGGRIDEDAYVRSMQSMIGNLEGYNAGNLMKQVVREQEGGYREGLEPRGPRRQLEQQCEQPSRGESQQQHAVEQEQQRRLPPGEHRRTARV